MVRPQKWNNLFTILLNAKTGDGVSQKFRLWIDRAPGEFDMVPFLRALTETASGRPVELVRRRSSADLRIITERTLARWVVSLGPTFSHVGRVPLSLLPPELLNRFLKLQGFGSRTIFVTAENLQHPAWVGIGDLLRRSSLPRLTCWPKDIDPEGERLPYWYSHVDWPELRELGPRSYPRFGQLLDLNRLMKPLSIDESRLDAIAVMVSHVKFPRDSVIDRIAKKYELATPSAVDRGRPKIDFLTRHKFSFAGENSFGIGYCTEKVPEAWHAGCIPIGVIGTPHSDWNSEVLGLYEHSTAVHEQPLLKVRPNLHDIIEYVQTCLR